MAGAGIDADFSGQDSASEAFALMAFCRVFAQETNLIGWNWNGPRRCLAQMHAIVMQCEKISQVLLRVFANFIK